MARMETPFSTSLLPEYLYLTDGLRAAIDKVRYVCDYRQGLTIVYGDVGHGKSSVLRLLHDEYAARQDAVTALLPTPRYKTDVGMLRAICGEFGLPVRRSMLDQEQALRGFLVEHYTEGRNAIVFIDEAQIIPGAVLELVRLLLNLETNRAKLIQVVMSGQLELRDRLRDSSKKALRSRIAITSTLDPLTLDDTRGMIAHRCSVAGAINPFGDDVLEAIWRRARGVPRDTLKLCAAAAHLAAMNRMKSVPMALVEHLQADVEMA